MCIHINTYIYTPIKGWCYIIIKQAKYAEFYGAIPTKKSYNYLYLLVIRKFNSLQTGSRG